MTTPLGLLSFRKNVARIVKKEGNDSGGDMGDDGDDGDDDGWVHGGKYVPDPRLITAKRQQPPSPSTPSVTATAANAVPSPYSMITPPPLNTPLPPDTAFAPALVADATRTAPMHQANNNSTPRTNSGFAASGARTPFTTQLQRLLAPTPPQSATRLGTANTPAQPIATTLADRHTPRNFQRGRQPTPLPPTPSTPVEKFLRQSGVTPKLSHTLGNAAFCVSSLMFSTFVFILNGIAARWNAFTTKYPHMASDVVESLFETVLDICKFLWKVVRFLLPFVLWIVQTLIALTLTLGGTIVWALVMLVRGRERADNSSAGEVHHSAVKSLKESVRNSPFKKGSSPWRRDGSRLPFMGFSHPSPPTPQRAENVGHPADRIVVGSNHAGNSANSAAERLPPANRSTPISSAIRSNLKRTPHASSNIIVNQTPASAARRVLFSETEHGEVSTEQFEFDKHLPASARKVDHRGSRGLEDKERKMEGESKAGVGDQPGLQRRFTPPREKDEEEVASTMSAAATMLSAALGASSALTSPSTTPENTILRPSKFEQNYADLSEDQGGRAPRQNATDASTKAVQPKIISVGRKEEPQLSEEEEERKKQQYIQRYGLLPTITPLSKRYGRMKQKQGLKSATNGRSIPADAASNAAATNNTSQNTNGRNKNLNRKRRGDLLGAASRLGRHRRARLGNHTTNSSLPSVFLSNNRTPMKRSRDEEVMSRTDEWVWRAMNHDEKENQKSAFLEQGSAAKRGKFAKNEKDSKDNEVVGTPPKNPTLSSLAHVMTPPKTPGPSKFVTAATPAPKKLSGCDDTPGKGTPSIPSFSFGAAATKGNTANEGVAVPGLSFGATAPTTQNKDGAASEAATSVFSTGTETKNAAESASAAPSTAPGFSFGASATTAPPVTATEKKDAAAPVAPAFSFGNNQQGISKPDEKNAATGAATTAPAPFSFGDSSKSATSFAGQSKPPSGVAFSFGATVPAPAGVTIPSGGTTAAAPAPAQFSFEASSQHTPATAAMAQPKQQPAPTSNSGAAFTFGTTVSATGGISAAGAAPLSFSFGAGAASSGVAPPAFGTASKGTSFSLGGPSSSSGGGSARRRAAKSGGRRR